MHALTEDACQSCDARIVWVKTTHGGRMPLDAEPHEEGSILVAFARDEPMGVVLTGDVLAWARDNDATLYRSHFASCPDAEQWRHESRQRRRTNERGTA